LSKVNLDSNRKEQVFVLRPICLPSNFPDRALEERCCQAGGLPADVTPPWPTKWPVSSLGALLIAVAVGIGISTDRNVGDVDALATLVLGPMPEHENFPDGARRLPIAGEGGRAREAAHGRRCRRGARSAAGVAPVSVSVSVCAYATGGAGGSRRAEGGHGVTAARK
jgi:hypothetical protein